MNVRVKLYGEFRKGAASPDFTFEIQDGATVDTLLKKLKLPEIMYKMILVNSFRAKDDWKLAEGDEVDIFQPIGGG